MIQGFDIVQFSRHAREPFELRLDPAVAWNSKALPIGPRRPGHPVDRDPVRAFLKAASRA
jgi:hypothetical protein